MAKVETTTKKFKEDGVRISGNSIEIHWESTGHLSVRLLDASGSHPLVGRAVNVDIPGEGSVSLETDEDGEISYPDVPYRDYKLNVDGIEVTVPAVGDPSEVHERHVAAAAMGFVHAVLYDAHGRLLEEIDVKVKFASGATVDAKTNTEGIVKCHHPEPGDGDVEITCELGRTTLKPLASPQKVVRLEIGQKGDA